MGANTKKALEQYQKQAPATPAAVEPVTAYTITPEDAAGPFVAAIPTDLIEQAKLPALGYTSSLEALAERFHSTPALLQRLNPGAQFAAGEQIQVPNVEPMVAPVEQPEPSPEALAARQRSARTPGGTTGRRGSRRAETAQYRDDAARRRRSPSARPRRR